MDGIQEKEETSTDHSSDTIALDEDEDPKNLAIWRKWMAVLVISSSSLCITCASTLAASAEDGLSREFGVKKIVSVLSISLFIEGLGLGPLVVGPLSEVYGRNPIYRASYVLLFALSWPVAFAPNIATFLVFRFLTGLCGAAFLSVAGGSVTDLFSDWTVANPMAVYTISPFLGPVIGPIISGFINEVRRSAPSGMRLGLNSPNELASVLAMDVLSHHCLELWATPRLTLLRSRDLRSHFTETKSSKVNIYDSVAYNLLNTDSRIARKSNQVIEKDDWRKIFHAILISCYTPFKLIFLDRMALLLDIWTALALGILYLAFQVYPIIFGLGHGFDLQQTGLGFLGVGVGLFLALATQPLWNRFHKKIAKSNGGKLPPEARLYMGQVGAVCIPVGLFWLAFTTYPSVHWIVPIIASVPFGAGIFFVFNSTFTYLVIAYRPVAASAMAGNSAMRATFGAVFPLFAGAMYQRLGTVGATALLAGLTAIMAPLPFVLVKIGPRLRSQSRFAV
ncbi:hypothetical protein D9756_011229 [Leucocoprinus leucothites]|uniref:Major facilitator superfamily (MFS) profile domain-containing protein n=1 Tax=Leucocoprinus leucothites TaxID=201217 RepID=A0A8H5FQ22_9AGAR|nr:hypothetical protein D9756_011229 [Leucoagaricus leucothites]